MESQDFNVVSIQDTILAGMYSNGYTDLETVNKDLFVSVNAWNKLFAKIDSNDSNIIKTLLISVSQSLINFDKKVLYICENNKIAVSNNEKFTSVLKFVDNVNSGVNDSEARLIFTTHDSLENYKDVGYVIIDNSLSEKLVERLNYSVNYAIFIQSDLTTEITQLVQKLNSIETEVFISQEVVNEQVEEEEVVDNQVVDNHEEVVVDNQEVVNEQVEEEEVVDNQEEVDNHEVVDEQVEEEVVVDNQEEVDEQVEEEVVVDNQEEVDDNQEEEVDSDCSSESSENIQNLLVNLNTKSLEEIKIENEKNRIEKIKSRNQSLLLKLASRRR